MTERTNDMTAVDAAHGTAQALAQGARFIALFVETGSTGAQSVTYVLDEARKLSRRTGTLTAATLPSLKVPAAGWAEREARDRFGLRFDRDVGARLIPPLDAEALLASASPEVSSVLYGPIRSGIVESAQWVVQTVGEDFVHVAPSMFYKRRGVEERFVGCTLDDGAFVAEFCSGATALSHACAYARAVETATGSEVPLRARAARSMLVEFERIHQHLDALAKLAEDGSLLVGSMQLFAAKERVHRLLAESTGSRFGRGVVKPGGLRADAFASLAEVCVRLLDEVEAQTRSVVEALFASQSLLDRLIGTGRLTPKNVVAFGGVGPVARGSGVRCDARAIDGALFTSLTGDEVLEEGTDAAARALVRRTEIRDSFRLIRNALDAAPSGAWCADVPDVDGCGIARVESPQGELVYAVRVLGGRLPCVRLRSASYANWPLFQTTLPGNIFTDFSFIDHSFGLLQAEVDR
ncbi:MAG: NADH-quinone oxidoreductase subunit D-related protein [Vulcanimicrobiaceae bacterium]